MNRKTTTLAITKKSPELLKLLSLYKTNPFHARVLFFSSSDSTEDFTRYKLTETVSKDNSSIVFTLWHIKYIIDDNSLLHTKKIKNYSWSLKRGKFVFEELITISYQQQIVASSLTLNNLLTSQITPHIEFHMALIGRWMYHFPWTTYMIEHHILNDIPLNEVFDMKLFSLKKAIEYRYYKPFDKALEYHKSQWTNHYDRLNNIGPIRPDGSKRNITNRLKLLIYDQNISYGGGMEIGPRHLKADNDTLYKFKTYLYNEHLMGDKLKKEEDSRLIYKALEKAKILNKRFNCGWSLSRIRDEKNKWEREYCNIIYTNNNELLANHKVHKDFSLATGIELIEDMKGLTQEGLIQNHCVGGYQYRIADGMGIYRYKGFTLALVFKEFIRNQTFYDNYGDVLPVGYQLYGLEIDTFLGYFNNTPSNELLDEVRAILVEYNRKVVTGDFDIYLDYINNAYQGGMLEIDSCPTESTELETHYVDMGDGEIEEYIPYRNLNDGCDEKCSEGLYVDDDYDERPVPQLANQNEVGLQRVLDAGDDPAIRNYPIQAIDIPVRQEALEFGDYESSIITLLEQIHKDASTNGVVLPVTLNDYKEFLEIIVVKDVVYDYVRNRQLHERLQKAGRKSVNFELDDEIDFAKSVGDMMAPYDAEFEALGDE